MRPLRCSMLTLAGACLCAALHAQIATQSEPAHRDVSVSVAYSALHANTVADSTFWMRGGSATAAVALYRGIGAAVDFDVHHAAQMPGLNVGLDLLTFTAGPRYTLAPRHSHASVFGQFLVGEAHGWNSVFPTSASAPTSDSSLAFKLGGGVDMRLRQHLALRALEAHWVRTALGNSTTGVQNNLWIGAGLVWHR